MYHIVKSYMKDLHSCEDHFIRNLLTDIFSLISNNQSVYNFISTSSFSSSTQSIQSSFSCSIIQSLSVINNSPENDLKLQQLINIFCHLVEVMLESCEQIMIDEQKSEEEQNSEFQNDESERAQAQMKENSEDLQSTNSELSEKNAENVQDES